MCVNFICMDFVILMNFEKKKEEANTQITRQWIQLWNVRHTIYEFTMYFATRGRLQNFRSFYLLSLFKWHLSYLLSGMCFFVIVVVLLFIFISLIFFFYFWISFRIHTRLDKFVRCVVYWAQKSKKQTYTYT